MVSSFEVEKMQTHFNCLGYRIDLYFHDHKRAIEIDENDHSDRNIDYEMKRQNLIEQNSSCRFIRIDPDKENFDVFKANQLI